MSKLPNPLMCPRVLSPPVLMFSLSRRSAREVGGPGNPEFRLRPNELLELFGALRVLYYREGIMKDPDGPTMALAQLVACRGSPGF